MSDQSKPPEQPLKNENKMRLPPELLLQIVDALADDRLALKNISTVHRLFYAGTMRHLFKELRIRESLEDTVQKLQAFCRLPAAKFIKVLYVEGAALISERILQEGERIDFESTELIESTLENSLEYSIATFGASLLCLFSVARNIITSICVEMYSQRLFIFGARLGVEIENAIFRCISHILGTMDLPLLCNITGNLAIPAAFYNLFGLRAPELCLEKCDTTSFDVTKLENNLRRIKEFRVDIYDDYGNDNPEQGWAGVDKIPIFLDLVCKRLPHLNTLELSRYEEDEPVDLQALRNLPLQNLSLSWIDVKNLFQVLQFTTRFKLVSFLHVKIGQDESWSVIFHRLNEISIKKLCLRDLRYIFQDGIQTGEHPGGCRTICTNRCEDVHALEALAPKVTAFWQSPISDSTQRRRYTVYMARQMRLKSMLRRLTDKYKTW